MKLVQWLHNNKIVFILCVCVTVILITTLAVTLTHPKTASQTRHDELIDSPTQKEMIINYRLPRKVKPKNYNLKLEPSLVNNTFKGTVAITIDVLLSTKELILHSKYLNISSVSLQNNSSKVLSVTHGLSGDQREFMYVKSKSKMAAGEVLVLEINYTGSLDGLVGFYRSTLKKGSTMVASKFQPTYARQAFPCFDEPEYKATFDITLVKPITHIALSNMNVRSFSRISDNKEKCNPKKKRRHRSRSSISSSNNFTASSSTSSSLCSCSSCSEYRYRHRKKKRKRNPKRHRKDRRRKRKRSSHKPRSCKQRSNQLATTTKSYRDEISKSQDDKTNLETVTFATSVPMSTYLACFVVCDFGYKQTEVDAQGIGKNFILQTYAQKDQMHKIDFALDIGKRATEYYIKYYEVPFPLPKLDMIAIPDYQSGATEHWGLITYRETSFLVDPTTTASKNKWNVANTIAHELAHMWFGNLVTLKWWDDLWLNEGFASYMQIKALNAIEPTWSMMELFLTKTLHSVLVTDAKLSSHPIVQIVDTPDQITSIFDAISYNKGASVLRMLEGFIGEENFRKGISDYLKKYQFGTTVTQDLLDLLEPYFKKDNPNLNLTHIMDTWTRQMGYPVIQVEKGAEPNTYVLTQTRFLIDPKAIVPNDSPFDYRWFVPITYKTNKGSSSNVLWFPDTSKNVVLNLSENETWLKLNNDQVGYYRVNYPLDMWEALIQQLKAKSAQLTISDRAHLLNDIFALAGSSRVPYELALQLTTYLSVEEDYVPWETAFAIFSVLDDRLMKSVERQDLQKYVQKLIQPLYKKQTWERVANLGVIESLLRSRILSMAARFGTPDAELKARELLHRWLDSQGTAQTGDIEPDLRDVVYYYGMKSATQEDWDKMWEIYMKEDDAQEQLKLRNALTAPMDTNILRKFLALAWDEKNIRGQDYLNVITSIASNPSGSALVWDHVRENWPKLVDRFTLNSRYLGNMIPAITSHFNTELKLKEMEALFAQYPEAGAGETARRRALETVRDNIRWANIHQPTVAKWLKHNAS